MRKSIIAALVLSTLSLSAVAAPITQGEMDAAYQQFQQGATLFNTLPDGTPTNQFNDAMQNALRGLERMGITGQNAQDAIANYSNYAKPADVYQWTGVKPDVDNSTSPPVQSHADFVGTGDYRVDQQKQAAVDDGQNHRITDLENQPKPKYGEKGDKGDKGDTGTAGVNGTNGVDGKDGVDGINGTNGKDVDPAVANQVKTNTGDIATETDARKAGDANLQIQVNSKVDQRSYDIKQAAQDAAIHGNTTSITTNSDAIATETNARKSDVTNITKDYTQRFERVDTRFADTDARIAEQKASQDRTNKRVAQNSADIANHEQRIGNLETQTTNKFAQLKSEVDNNRKRASAGIAGVAAMANIPQVTEYQSFAVGAGVGNTDGESALAVGFSGRASQNTVIKASVSNDSQHNFVVGAGVSYGW